MRKCRTLSAAAILAGAALAVPATAPAQEIAFQSDRQGDSDIWIMSSNGSGRRVLTVNRWEDATPAWSPDGERIAYAAAPDGVQFDLYEIPFAGGDPQQLTNTPQASEFDPVYSRDGTKIAFETVTGRDSDIAYIDVGGSGAPIRLTAGPAFDGDPSFTPDSARVAYDSRRTRDSDILVVPVVAPGQSTPLISGPTRDYDPDFALDGRIAFARERKTRRILVMNEDGTGLLSVTRSRGDDYGARWTADGRLLFSRAVTPDTRYGVFRIEPKAGAAGAPPRKVGPTVAADDSEPTERPRARAARRRVLARMAACPYTTKNPWYGNSYPNCRHGGGGNDEMYGRGDDDTLYGDTWNDDLYGGTGEDTLIGGYGADDLHAAGDGQADSLYGGPGVDEAWTDDSDTTSGVIVASQGTTDGIEGFH